MMTMIADFPTSALAARNAGGNNNLYAVDQSAPTPLSMLEAAGAAAAAASSTACNFSSCGGSNSSYNMSSSNNNYNSNNNSNNNNNQCFVGTITIPRKLHDQLAQNPQMAQELSERLWRTSGVQFVEVTNRDNRRVAPTGSPESGECSNDNNSSSYNNNTQLMQHKPRREYFLRVAGTQEQVNAAREEITRTLRNENNGERVTLKMDVSFSDHSFVIGKRGKGIQAVMRKTDCHIHFPDSNRNHQSEKSNQVSVAGAPDRVLEARKKIRELLPISFVFVVKKVDFKNCIELQPDDEERPQLRRHLRENIEVLQNEYRMTINWLPMKNFSCAMVTVRGRRSNIHRIREGLQRLMSYLRPNKPQFAVYLGIEVSPHHLSYVLGQGDAKIRALKNATNVEFKVISFQGGRMYRIPTVRIFGQVDNVYKAWLGFMDLLPAVLLIDVPDVYGVTPIGQPFTAKEISVLSELGVVSQDSLPLVSRATEAHPDTGGPIHSGVGSVVSLTAQLNALLYNYDISVMLRMSRDYRQWKFVARGPERHVDLLMDVYRALSRPDLDPVLFIKKAIKSAPPPIWYGQSMEMRPTAEVMSPSHSQAPHPVSSFGPTNSLPSPPAPMTPRRAEPYNPKCSPPPNWHTDLAASSPITTTTTTTENPREEHEAGTAMLRGGRVRMGPSAPDYETSAALGGYDLTSFDDSADDNLYRNPSAMSDALRCVSPSLLRGLSDFRVSCAGDYPASPFALKRQPVPGSNLHICDEFSPTKFSGGSLDSSLASINSDGSPSPPSRAQNVFGSHQRAASSSLLEPLLRETLHQTSASCRSEYGNVEDLGFYQLHDSSLPTSESDHRGFVDFYDRGPFGLWQPEPQTRKPDDSPNGGFNAAPGAGRKLA